MATLFKQLWLPNLIRFTRIRAAYNATGTDKTPYARKGGKNSKRAVRVGAAYLLLQVAALTGLTWYGNAYWLAVVSVVLWAAVTVIFLRLPASSYHQSRIHPFIPQAPLGVDPAAIPV